MKSHWRVMLLSIVVLVLGSFKVSGLVSPIIMKRVRALNEKGPYFGIVIPNNFEMDPLLQSSSFVPDQKHPYLEFSGRRFRIGVLENQKVILVMTGLGMLNAGTTTQLLVALFRLKGVLHYGIAGNANPDFQIGDVTIPQYWAHTGLWNWQRFGDGAEDELALESNGDYTRRFGYLHFSDFNVNNSTTKAKAAENLLNNVWFQPEEIFPVFGYPEARQHALWVAVDPHYYRLTKKLENLKLSNCVNTTCLPRAAKVVRVSRGVSANIFVDNSAFRQFLRSKFNATPIDMESAAVALVCFQQKMPFIAIRALSDLAGGGSALSNEAALFAALAAQNAVDVLIKAVELFSASHE